MSIDYQKERKVLVNVREISTSKSITFVLTANGIENPALGRVYRFSVKVNTVAPRLTATPFIRHGNNDINSRNKNLM